MPTTEGTLERITGAEVIKRNDVPHYLVYPDVLQITRVDVRLGTGRTEEKEIYAPFDVVEEGKRAKIVESRAELTSGDLPEGEKLHVYHQEVYVDSQRVVNQVVVTKEPAPKE
jgi:hypothetical protein